MNHRESDQTSSSSSTPTQPARFRKDASPGGIVLIVLGLLFLADNFLPQFNFSQYWPVILIAIGASLLWKARRP